VTIDHDPGHRPRPAFTPAIDSIAERLSREFDGIFSPEAVRLVVEGSSAEFDRATATTFVPVFVERHARARLRAAARSEGKAPASVPMVVFLCVHNAGRSQMAAGWLRHLGGNAVEVFSGGSEPAEAVNPSAAAAMREVGIDLAEEFPKPWTDDVLRAADVIVTMGCGDTCPVYPGTRYLDWKVDDPAGLGVEEVRPIRDEIERRVRGLMRELGVPEDG
jgi:protein-tyrosine-phosphatase